jgi:hypothetical protein
MSSTRTAAPSPRNKTFWIAIDAENPIPRINVVRDHNSAFQYLLAALSLLVISVVAMLQPTPAQGLVTLGKRALSADNCLYAIRNNAKLAILSAPHTRPMRLQPFLQGRRTAKTILQG